MMCIDCEMRPALKKNNDRCLECGLWHVRQGKACGFILNPVHYVWVPFSWLPTYALFEHEDTIRGYMPVMRKINNIAGYGKSHMGDVWRELSPDEYVRVFVGGN